MRAQFNAHKEWKNVEKCDGHIRGGQERNTTI